MMFQTTDYFLIILLLFILTASAIIDFRVQRIPNLITFPTVIIALLFHFLAQGVDGLIFSTLGLATGIGLLIIPYMFGVSGAGDAKLMGSVGAVLGSKSVFTAFLFTAIVGGIYAIVLILFNKKQFNKKQFKGFFKKQLITLKLFILTREFIPDPIEENNKKPKLCYGVAIALGTFIYLGLDLSGHHLIF
jgi:prepilin peptidase CpaA